MKGSCFKVGEFTFADNRIQNYLNYNAVKNENYSSNWNDILFI